jgi:hypothetical protein
LATPSLQVAGLLTTAEDCALLGAFHLVGFDGDVFENFIDLG